MVQLSATRCSCIAILRVSLVSFAAITLCVASQRVFIVIVVYFVIDSVWKLLDTLSCSSERDWYIIYNKFCSSPPHCKSVVCFPSIPFSKRQSSSNHVTLLEEGMSFTKSFSFPFLLPCLFVVWLPLSPGDTLHTLVYVRSLLPWTPNMECQPSAWIHYDVDWSLLEPHLFMMNSIAWTILYSSTYQPSPSPYVPVKQPYCPSETVFTCCLNFIYKCRCYYIDLAYWFHFVCKRHVRHVVWLGASLLKVLLH
jgi:hypothetical protein